MTFSKEVKSEICHIFDLTDDQKKSLLSSFLSNNAQIKIINKKESWICSSQFQQTIIYISKLAIELYNVNKSIKIYSSINKKNKLYTLEISDKNLDDIQKDLGFFYFDNNFYKKSSTNKCYLTGAFLSNGSVSTQNSKISLIELTTNKQKYFKIIKSILNKYNIKINQIIKPNEYIIHIKNNSSILDFLKIVNAHQCMLDYETKIIETNRFAKINRINNLELSNLKKTSITNYKQIEMIKQIINSEEYEKQNQKFKSYCNARLAYPDYSLTDIIRFFNDDLGIKISKSALNHYSIKIKKIFNSK